MCCRWRTYCQTNGVAAVSGTKRWKLKLRLKQHTQEEVSGGWREITTHEYMSRRDEQINEHLYRLWSLIHGTPTGVNGGSAASSIQVVKPQNTHQKICLIRIAKLHNIILCSLTRELSRIWNQIWKSWHGILRVPSSWAMTLLQKLQKEKIRFGLTSIFHDLHEQHNHTDAIHN